MAAAFARCNPEVTPATLEVHHFSLGGSSHEEAGIKYVTQKNAFEYKVQNPMNRRMALVYKQKRKQERDVWTIWG